MLGVGGALATNFDSIATASGTGSSNTISFTSISSAYKHLQIRYIARSTFAGTSINLLYTLNNDTTAANYPWHALRGDGASASSINGLTLNLLINEGFTGSTAGTGQMGVGVIDFLDYANTNKNKTQRALGGQDRNGAGQVTFQSSLWLNTAAINRIDLIAQSGNFTTDSHFALYGIKA